MGSEKLTKALAEIGRLRAENAKYARWLNLSHDQSDMSRARIESSHEMLTLFREQQEEHIRSLYPASPLRRSALSTTTKGVGDE